MCVFLYKNCCGFVILWLPLCLWVVLDWSFWFVCHFISFLLFGLKLFLLAFCYLYSLLLLLFRLYDNVVVSCYLGRTDMDTEKRKIWDTGITRICLHNKSIFIIFGNVACINIKPNARIHLLTSATKFLNIKNIILCSSKIVSKSIQLTTRHTYRESTTNNNRGFD